MHTKSLLYLSILLCSSFANMSYASQSYHQRIKDESDKAVYGSVCCCAISSIALVATVIYKIEHKQQLCPTNYQPAFKYPDKADILAQLYCPNFLRAGPVEQTMMETTPACFGLNTFEQDSNQHHATMLKEVAEAFPNHLDGYCEVVRLSSNEHAHHLAQIALAKEKCGCIETKKTK